jgi:hypothetical protein
MVLLLAFTSIDQIAQIVMIIIAVILALFVARFLLRLAMRILTIGCGLIVLFGITVAALYYLGLI